MIGDDIVSDIQGAQRVGLKGVLVRSGKYRRELHENHLAIRPDMMCHNLIHSVARNRVPWYHLVPIGTIIVSAKVAGLEA